MAPDTGMNITELNEAILALVGVKRLFRDLEHITSHRTDNVERLWEWAGDQGELVGDELHRLMTALEASVPANDEEGPLRAIALAAGADHMPAGQGWRIAVAKESTDG